MAQEIKDLQGRLADYNMVIFALNDELYQMPFLNLEILQPHMLTEVKSEKMNQMYSRFGTYMVDVLAVKFFKVTFQHGILTVHSRSACI